MYSPVPLSIPEVEKSSKGTLVEDLDNVTLTCTVEKGTKPKFEWFRNNHPVNPSKRHVFLQNNSSLYISPVKKEDMGKYNCRVQNPISRFRSKVMEISVCCECFMFFVPSFTTLFRFTPRTFVSFINPLQLHSLVQP